MAGTSNDSFPAELLVDIVKQLFPNRKVDHFDIKTDVIIKKPDTVLSDVFRIQFTERDVQKPTEKRVVVKVAPGNTARRQCMSIKQIYHREKYMYESIIKSFEALPKKLEKAIIIDMTGKMIASQVEKIHEYIAFDDLEPLGYHVYDRREPLSYDMARLSIEGLAKFHAMSLVTQSIDKTAYNQWKNSLRRDMIYNDDMEASILSYMQKYFRKTIQALTAKTVDAEILESMNRLKNNYEKMIMHLADGKKIEPYAVFCHGDYGCNNIMYKFDESKKPTAIKIIDFQLARYSSPILDLSYFIFCCTEKSLRDNHYAEFKTIYYDALSEHIQQLGSDPEQLYSRKQFDQHYDEYAIYGLYSTICGLPFYLAKIGEKPAIDELAEEYISIKEKCIEDLKKEVSNSADIHARDYVDDPRMVALYEKFEVLSERTLPLFNQRICDVVLDMHKLGYLKLSDKI